MSTWAVIADVLAKTGRLVDQPTLDQAEAQIELVTGVIAADGATLANARDTYWLQAATCYQAAWVSDQPDLYLRSDVAGIQQDGSSVQFKPDALVLAPLARRAIKRLSWRGTRSLNPLAPGERRRRLADTQGDDETLIWEPYTS